MPTSRQLRERLKRALQSIGQYILSHKGAVLVWVCLVLPFLGLLVWIIWETVRLKNTGFGEQALWDWMDLLLVPAALGVGIWWLNRSEKTREAAIARDRQQEAALQAYFDAMTELLLKHSSTAADSPGPEPSGEEEKEKLRRSLARTRTLSILKNSGGKRKDQILKFLYESELIQSPAFVDMKLADLSSGSFDEITLEQVNGCGVLLNGADLRGSSLNKAKLEGIELRFADLRWARLEEAQMSLAKLSNAKMENASLRGAILSDAILREAYLYNADLRGCVLRNVDFRGATLSNADLREANLEGADLREANLEGADLRNAVLKGANLTAQQLEKAGFLAGATMPGSETSG